ncbi:hypothetical protein BDZ97DRAFT_1283675 [Flammula alnicola]|nr:hypothetical protein BDZ97DRAFT_1283675 [Flammula alnicola]
MAISAAEPLKTARLVSLILAWCFSVIAASVGLNALIKSNQDKSKLKKLAPAPTVVTIDTSDIFDAGVIATTAALVISIIVSKFVTGMLLPATKALSRRTLRLQAFILIGACTLLFGAMIPYIIFFANRHAIVKAFIGTTQLPDSIIESAAKAAGSTSIYKDISYLKLLAVFPWFSLFFTLVAAGILYKAGGVPIPDTKHVHESSPSTPTKEDMMKEDVSHLEKANDAEV